MAIFFFYFNVLSHIGLEVSAYLSDKAQSVTVVGRSEVPLKNILGDKVGLAIKKVPTSMTYPPNKTKLEHQNISAADTIVECNIVESLAYLSFYHQAMHLF